MSEASFEIVTDEKKLVNLKGKKTKKATIDAISRLISKNLGQDMTGKRLTAKEANKLQIRMGKYQLNSLSNEISAKLKDEV